MTENAGADVVIAAAPAPDLQAAALRIAAPQGRVLLFAGLPETQSGVELDTNLIHYKELLGDRNDSRPPCPIAGRLSLSWSSDSPTWTGWSLTYSPSTRRGRPSTGRRIDQP